jgi:hypothetical protein
LKDKKFWKELIRLLSVDDQPTKAVLAQTCTGEFSIHSVHDAILFMFFFPKAPADRLANGRGPQFEKRYYSWTT